MNPEDKGLYVNSDEYRAYLAADGARAEARANAERILRAAEEQAMSLADTGNKAEAAFALIQIAEHWVYLATARD